MGRRSLPLPIFVPFEAEARLAGYRLVAGLDEAGRGPLAGPVVAAAVILPAHLSIPGVQDSKRLTARQRERIYAAICMHAVTYGIGLVSPRQIDLHNIVWATREAMHRAVRHLAQRPDMLLIDGTERVPVPIAQQAIIRGDAQCTSIAAASILAKVTRDRLMVHYARRYPAYGFERHKGYPTPEHYGCLQRYGPCRIHRRSFRGVLQAPEEGKTAR